MTEAEKARALELLKKMRRHDQTAGTLMQSGDWQSELNERRLADAAHAELRKIIEESR